jgi:beta-glucosidase
MQSDLNPTASEPSFLWGVATSGYQSEGGYNTEGQPQNNWTLEEARGSVMRTGNAADFWTRYKEDFQRCQLMGLNAFRIGLEWARIQPSTSLTPTAAPPFDPEALDAYADRIAACRQYGLEPIVTLHHFTHPAWLGIDAWLTQETIDGFVEYVQVSVAHINRRLTAHYNLLPIRWYITINEPNMLVTSAYLSGQFPAKTRGFGAVLKAYDHLLAAHVRAYCCIHDLYVQEGWETPQVSLNTYCSDLYWSEKVIWDLLDFPPQMQPHPLNDSLDDYIYDRARQFVEQVMEAELSFRRDIPYRVGRLAGHLANGLGHRLFKAKSLETYWQALAAADRPSVIDYVAIDYYDPFIAHIFRLPTFTDFEFAIKDIRDWLMNGITSKWWNWRSLPEGLHFFCKYYAQEFNRPVMIAENGMALRRKPDNSVATHRPDQLKRSEFLEAHLEQVKRLLDEAVPLIGYMHWSLTDNYEWGSYTPRFGLFSIDFEAGTDRIIEDHLGDRPSETYAQCIKSFQQMKPPALLNHQSKLH